MNINIRLETPGDFRTVEELTREAFWGEFKPICDEHYLVHLLRAVPAFVPQLDFIAETDEQIVGNVMYSKAKIIGGGNETEVLTFGPLSVLPAFKRSGIGSALMRHSLTEAKRLGYRAVVFFGHPDYYPRFGFRCAADFGITAPGGASFDALMAMQLYDGALDGISGEFHEDPVFELDSAEAEAFERGFPPKEPAVMLPIELLTDRLKPATRRTVEELGITELTWLKNVSGRELLRLDGFDACALRTVNTVLQEVGWPRKLPPWSPILQTASMDLRLPVIERIREKDGISVSRVESEGMRSVLKVFEKLEDAREIENYALLSSLGVPTLPVLRQTENALLLPDVHYSAEWRLGTENDLLNTESARALARWYRTLHESGLAYLSRCACTLYAETDFFTPENMLFTARKTNTMDNPLWSELQTNFDKLLPALNALPRTLTYNDFHRTNLLVAKDGSSAMMLDFHMLGTGYAYADVRNVTGELSGAAKGAFLEEYGPAHISPEELRTDAVVGPLVALYRASLRSSPPAWAKPLLLELTDGTLLHRLHRWLGSI